MNMHPDVYDAFEDASLKLGEAVDAVQNLAQVCEQNQAGENGMAHKRIEAYLLPHLSAWLSDEGQIGSFPRLWDELNEVVTCYDHGNPVPCLECEGE